MRATTVNVIIAVNVIVFLLWQLWGSAWPSFMTLHFLTSWDALMSGRIWTLVTSVFSHNTLWHLLMNMFVLSSFGTLMSIVLGVRSFLTLYFIAGIMASLAHCIVSMWLIGSPDLPVLGASGAISAIILVFALMFPRQRILLFGVIPIPALVGAALFIGLDIWGLIVQASGGGLPIGHGAHLGGALTGIAYFYLKIRPQLWEYRRRL